MLWQKYKQVAINHLCLILISITPLLAEATGSSCSLADKIEQLSPSVVIVKGETITQRFEPGRLIVTHNWRLGSGFIVEDQGYILTCHHIIDGIGDIKVVLKNGTEYSARIVKINKQADLCLLKIKAHDLPSIQTGDPSIVRAGDFVITIGNPLPKQMNAAPKSFNNSVATGIIGSVDRVNPDNLRLFQLNLPVNFGNSGGPLFNRQGQVIGMVNSKMLAFNGHSIEGIGFALSIKEAAGIINIAKANTVAKTKQQPKKKTGINKKLVMNCDIILAVILLTALSVVRRRRIIPCLQMIKGYQEQFVFGVVSSVAVENNACLNSYSTLIEITNHGLKGISKDIELAHGIKGFRYEMTLEDVLKTIASIKKHGYFTLGSNTIYFKQTIVQKKKIDKHLRDRANITAHFHIIPFKTITIDKWMQSLALKWIGEHSCANRLVICFCRMGRLDNINQHCLNLLRHNPTNSSLMRWLFKQQDQSETKNLRRFMRLHHENNC
ncbi:MAG: trypsin-like peptidase domain-containing protein [bacterium]